MEKDPLKTYTVCPDDPGIILTSDLADMALINQPGIRLVHVQGAFPEAASILAKIERQEFFKTLSDNFWFSVMSGNPTDADELLQHERDAYCRMMMLNTLVQMKIEEAGLSSGQKGIMPELRTRFGRYANSLSGTRWHTDAVNVVSVCVDGLGTEYLIGEMTSHDIDMISAIQEIPAHVRVGRAQPGDVLAMRGRNQLKTGGFTEAFSEASTRAIYHRGPLTFERRATLLYPC